MQQLATLLFAWNVLVFMVASGFLLALCNAWRQKCSTRVYHSPSFQLINFSQKSWKTFITYFLIVNLLVYLSIEMLIFIILTINITHKTIATHGQIYYSSILKQLLQKHENVAAIVSLSHVS